VTTLIPDASVVVNALADDDRDGDEARSRLAGERLVAPAIVDLEVISTFRRAARLGKLDPRRSSQALADLTALPLRRVSPLPLLTRIWELRENLSSYDASYVALAELLGGVLATTDARLARAPGTRCEIDLLT
jgi:predicted nucleic acid-binding protein